MHVDIWTLLHANRLIFYEKKNYPTDAKATKRTTTKKTIFKIEKKCYKRSKVEDYARHIIEIYLNYTCISMRKFIWFMAKCMFTLTHSSMNMMDFYEKSHGHSSHSWQIFQTIYPHANAKVRYFNLIFIYKTCCFSCKPFNVFAVV